MSRQPSEADIAAAERVLGDLEEAWAKEPDLPEQVIADARAMIARLKAGGFQPQTVVVHPNALQAQGSVEQAIAQFNARIISPNELRELVGPE